MSAAARHNPNLRNWLDAVVHKYLLTCPNEQAHLIPLREALVSDADLGNGATLPLHLTASAVVLDAQGTYLLLLFHRALRNWLQPGGHLEPGEYPAEAAARELDEECQLAGTRLESPEDLPFDIDIHPIPANPGKGRPAHHHCDFRYLFRAARGPVRLSRESLAVEWVPRDEKLEALTQGRMSAIIAKLDQRYPLNKANRPSGEI